MRIVSRTPEEQRARERDTRTIQEVMHAAIAGGYHMTGADGAATTYSGVKPRRATACGAARHWPFAGGASHPTLDQRGSLSPLETPGVGGTRPPTNPHSHSSPPQAVGHPGPFS